MSRDQLAPLPLLGLPWPFLRTLTPDEPVPICSDEKGFNVVTLTDCTAAMSEEGQAGATGGTYGMFSSPMTKDEFLATVAP